MLRARHALYLVLPMVVCAMPRDVAAAEPTTFATLAKDYDGKVRPILKQTCLNCHSTKKHKGELDLEAFASSRTSGAIPRSGRRSPRRSTTARCLRRGAGQLSAAERTRAPRLGTGATSTPRPRPTPAIPGAVVMRRLSNVEYNNTVRDLTGIDLQPAREFPADAAAGEGFTNVGDALVMSPSMLDKYLAAAKGIAAHAVLLPDGFRFSEKTTRPDWTEEILTEIKSSIATTPTPGEHAGQSPGPAVGHQLRRTHPAREVPGRDPRPSRRAARRARRRSRRSRPRTI